MVNNTTTKPMETSKEAKEKALELHNKFYLSILEKGAKTYASAYNAAKQCAIICVDEMLEMLEFDLYTFWQQVKHEIQQL